MSWGEHDERLFCGVAAFFRNSYSASLVTGVAAGADRRHREAREGARVADVGCGHGHSTVLMAKAYPTAGSGDSTFMRTRLPQPERWPGEAGVDDRVTFEVAKADGYPQNDYDLICFFDCLHDMGRPVDAARHAARRHGRRRHAHAGRAIRRRPRRGQHQPDRPALLCRLDDVVLRPRHLREGHARSRRSGGTTAARAGVEVGRARLRFAEPPRRHSI